MCVGCVPHQFPNTGRDIDNSSLGGDERVDSFEIMGKVLGALLH